MSERVMEEYWAFLASWIIMLLVTLEADPSIKRLMANLYL